MVYNTTCTSQLLSYFLLLLLLLFLLFFLLPSSVILSLFWVRNIKYQCPTPLAADWGGLEFFQ